MSTFRPALVVVDVQNGFVNADSAPVIPVIADLVSRWLDAGGHVIFTRYRNYPGSPFERLIGWYGLHGSPETDLADELIPFAVHKQAHVTDKTTYTALDDQGRALIGEQGFTDLFICGIATDGCVLATALAAFDSGLVPWILADACASNATSMPPEEAHRAALMLLSRQVGAGQIIRSEEALAKLVHEPRPVVASIVVSRRGVLIGRRNDGEPPWTFIAGEVEPGESADDAAIREVKEETGLLVRSGGEIGRRVHPKTGRMMIYIAAEPTYELDIFVGDEAELAEVRWAGLAEATELLPGMYEPVCMYLSREVHRLSKH